MFKDKIRIVAGILVSVMVITTVPADVFTATEKDKYLLGTSVAFTAGAHLAIEESVVLDNLSEEYFISGVVNGEAPLVSEPEEPKVNPYENMAVAQVREYVNVRSEANADSQVLGKLYNNGVATVLETLDGWYKVQSGNVTGYISAEFLVVGDEALCASVGQRVATVTTSRLNLRREPSTSAGVKTVITNGQQATVLDESIEGWVQVQYRSYTGYISKEFVALETIYNYAESREEEAARLAAAAEAQRRAEAEAAYRRQQEEAARKNYVPPTGGTGQDVVNYAVQFVGNPYVLGGSSLTNGIDCSWFVSRIYEAFGVSLPHNSYKLRSVGYEVSASELQPGDIICYSGHVSIYIGNGAIVHAANRKDGIKISSKWNYTHVITIRRIF